MSTKNPDNDKDKTIEMNLEEIEQQVLKQQQEEEEHIIDETIVQVLDNEKTLEDYLNNDNDKKIEKEKELELEDDIILYPPLSPFSLTPNNPARPPRSPNQSPSNPALGTESRNSPNPPDPPNPKIDGNSPIPPNPWGLNEGKDSIYDYIVPLFNAYQESIEKNPNQTKPYDFRFKGIKIGEVTKDGEIKFCKNSKLKELKLDIDKIKEKIEESQYGQKNNIDYSYNNAFNDKYEKKFVKEYLKKHPELEEEIESEEKIEPVEVIEPEEVIDFEEEPTPKTNEEIFFEKLKYCNEDEFNVMYNEAIESDLMFDEFNDWMDKDGNNIFHIMAQNPNLTPEMLSCIHQSMDNDVVAQLYLETNYNNELPLTVANKQPFDNQKTVLMQKTFGDKKQFFDVPQTFSAISLGTNIALEKLKYSEDDITKTIYQMGEKKINQIYFNTLKEQMSNRKDLIESFEFTGENNDIKQVFEKESVTKDENTMSNLIKYNFTHEDENGKIVLDSITLSENKNGLSIIESTNQNLTSLVKYNFKIEQDSNYRLSQDISKTTAFIEPTPFHEETPDFFEFPHEYMKENNYFPPMFVTDERNEKNEKLVIVLGKDKFGNDKEYKMTDTQLTNVIDNALIYAAKMGENPDLNKDKTIAPESHKNFIQKHNPSCDITECFTNSVETFENKHAEIRFKPFVASQDFKLQQEKEQNFEKAKQLALEKNKNYGGMEM